MKDYNFGTVADVKDGAQFAGPTGTLTVTGGKLEFRGPFVEDHWDAELTDVGYWSGVFQCWGFVTPPDLEPSECGRGGWDDAELVMACGGREVGFMDGVLIGLDVATDATIIFDPRLPKVAVYFLINA